MYKLVIQDDEGKTTVVPLIRDEITIGRKEGNTIRLTERNVSRKHARIVRANGAVAIEDLGSYNGVRVNGTRINQRTPLTISDRVQIGDYLIELKAEGAEIAATPGYDDAKTQPVERIDPNYRGPTVPLGALPPPVPGSVQGMQLVGSPESTLVALQDTDPRMQAAHAARAGAVAPVGSVSGHARLVVLSSNFAGREFELSKPQMVIGRTDDNDVVVNHRSISRNHAKVVREPETGRYTIMDMQSSNGVRVNGEEYGKVELRRGDLVDLGHVRMRFVDVGEDFLFGRDAQIVDVPTGSKKGIVFAVLALLVIGGGVGVFLMTRGGDKPDGDSVASGTDKGNPVVKVDAGGVVETPTPDAAAGSANDKALNDAKMAVQNAIDEERWPEVISACKEVQAINPEDPECKDKIAQAQREQEAQLKYDDFVKAVADKDYVKVATIFRELDADSIYKERAREAHDRVRDEYVTAVKSNAARFAKKGDCKEVAKLADQADRLWTEAGDAARAELAKCDQVAVADAGSGKGTGTSKGTGKGTGTSKGTGKGTGTGTSSGTSSSGSGKSVAELVTEANDAARNGQYGKAVRAAEEALKQDPGNQQALTAAAIAACNLKDAGKAKKYINRLSGQRQGMVRQVCLRNNVSID